MNPLVRLQRQGAGRRSSDAAVNAVLHDALDALADHIALLGPDGEVIAVNRAWEDFAAANGNTADSGGLGTNYCEVCDRASGVGADEAHAAAVGIRQVLAGIAESFELEYPCDTPTTTRCFRMAVRRVTRPGPVAAVVTHSDRTREQVATAERERLVASLEAERSHLAAIFQHAPAFLAVLRGPSYIFQRINPAYLQLVGHRDPIGMSLLEALPELRDQGFIEILDRVYTTGEPFIGRQMPVRLARAPGAPLETRYVDIVYQRLMDTDGDRALVSHGVDVTEQVLARDNAQLASAQLAAIVRSSIEAIMTADMEGRITSWNPAAERLFGFSREEILGRHISILHPDGPEQTSTLLEAVLRGEITEEPAAARSRKDGTVVQVSVTLFPLRNLDGGIIGMSAVARDTTERSELDAQVRQAQKMEAIGRLAGGVAHDFNNLLTVIGAHSAFLLESLDPSDPQYEDAEAIRKAGIRASGLTRQLLAFSRKQLLKPTRLALNAIVEDTRRMLERLVGEDVRIVTRLASDLGYVIADASQFDQVLMNLVVNARDAMPDGGSLTITTRNVDLTANMTAARRVIPPGNYVVLEVTDTGVGMDAAVQARLFEPFFTTKEPGQGTGLGLATVYGIVKQSGGYVLVTSALAQGTTFHVYLPHVVVEKPGDELQVNEIASTAGVETVLVVEDESAVRDIARSVLSRLGYVVLLAPGGHEALATSAAFASTIHLVVSDAVMPGMGGAEAVQRLQQQRPGLKALFMSGYTDDEMMRSGIVSSEVRFLQKPFEPAGLARAVRDALDA
jgi:PAS domain S-box-containing protein